MTWDTGASVISSAGTPKSLSGDLNASASVRAETKIRDIIFKAPSGNAGNVFVGRVGRDNSTAIVSSAYGITLAPGESFEIRDVNEKFNVFQADAATTNDKVEWSVLF